MNQLTAAVVHQAACGRWIDILQALTSNLAEALKRPGRHVSCPVHGGKDGFRFFKDAQQRGGAVCNTHVATSDGFSLLMWLHGWNFSQALREVSHCLGLAGQPANKLSKMLATSSSNGNGNNQDGGSSQHDAKVAATIDRIWREALPYSAAAARPLQRYLSARAILYLHNRIQQSDSLRFHPHLPYYRQFSERARFPALLGAIRDSQGQLVTVQRIYLDEDGNKAAVSSPKKMLPLPSSRTLAGAAIPLGEPVQGILGVAEGLETALAVASVTPYPVWSAVNAALLAQFAPPAGVHTLLIWADRDRSLVGEKAANSLKRQLVAQGLQVHILLPDTPIPAGGKSVDWNDVLLHQGTQGFPKIENLRNFLE